MASFIAPNYIPQFSQYIPEIDPQTYAQTAEVYQKAILEKQSQYQAGVQRVQSVFDQIGGIELIKDVDKDYYNQKLGQIRTQAQQLVKGADFSQMSTVNQIGGLASQIYSDKTIQNAAVSTRQLKSYQESKAASYKAGKGSSYNDYYTDRIVNEWIQNPNAGAQLGNIKYVDYFDDIKGFQDYVKDINPNITVEVDPYGRNADGSPNWNAYALVEGKKVQISKDEIIRQAQLYYSSNPLAAQQLEVNSTYYADHTSDSAALAQFQQAAQNTISIYNQQISQLEEKKNTSNGDSTQIDQQLTQLKTERDTYLNRVNSTTPESISQIKKDIYRNNLFSGLADRFDKLEFSQNVVSNPIFQAQMEERNFQLSTARFEFDQRKWAEEKDLKAKELAQTNSGFLGVNPASEEKINPNQIVNSVKELGTSVISEARMVLRDSDVYTDGLTDAQVMAKVEQLREQYQSNPMGVNPNLREYFQSTTNSDAGYGKMLSYINKRDLVTQAENNIRNSEIGRQLEASLNAVGSPDTVVGYVQTATYTPGASTRDFQKTWTNSRPVTLGEYKEAIYSGKRLGDDSLERFVFENDRFSPLEKVADTYKREAEKLKLSEYRRIVNATPSVTETYSTKDVATAKRGQEIANQLLVLAPAESQKNKISELLSGSEGVIVTGVKDNLIGGTTAVIRKIGGSESDAVVVNNITAENARAMFPSISTSDPLSQIREELRYSNSTKNYYSPADFNPESVYNLKRYGLRTKLKKTAGGSYYSTVEYKDNENPNFGWSKLRDTDPVSDPQQAIQKVVQMASFGDAIITDNTYR